jgi:hypothetical protein
MERLTQHKKRKAFGLVRKQRAERFSIINPLFEKSDQRQDRVDELKSLLSNPDLNPKKRKRLQAELETLTFRKT